MKSMDSAPDEEDSVVDQSEVNSAHERRHRDSAHGGCGPAASDGGSCGRLAAPGGVGFSAWLAGQKCENCAKQPKEARISDLNSKLEHSDPPACVPYRWVPANATYSNCYGTPLRVVHVSVRKSYNMRLRSTAGLALRPCLDGTCSARTDTC